MQRSEIGDALGVIGEAADLLQQIRTDVLIINNSTAGPFMDHRLPHSSDMLKVCFQEIRLFQCHPILAAADTHAPTAFMHNLKFHS